MTTAWGSYSRLAVEFPRSSGLVPILVVPSRRLKQGRADDR
jgi:hypothetical protein